MSTLFKGGAFARPLNPIQFAGVKPRRCWHPCIAARNGGLVCLACGAVKLATGRWRLPNR